MNLRFRSGRPGKVTLLFVGWSWLGMVLGLSVLFSGFQSRTVINLVYLEFSKTILSDSVGTPGLDGVEYRFESLIQSGWGDDSIWSALAKAAIVRGDVPRASDRLARVQDPFRRAMGFYELGWKLYEQEDYLRAARYWKQITPPLSDLSWAMAQRAEAAAIQQEWDSAVNLYSAALELGPEDPLYAATIHAKLAKILRSRFQDYVAAEAHLQEAVRLDPDRRVEYRSSIAGVYWEAGRWNDALVLLEELSSVAPQDDGVHAAMAYTYIHFGEWDKARQAASRATALNPRNAWAYSLSGTVARHYGEYEQALLFTQQATSLRPDEVQYWVELGDTYRLLRKDDLALETYQRALVLDNAGRWANTLKERIKSVVP